MYFCGLVLSLSFASITQNSSKGNSAFIWIVVPFFLMILSWSLGYMTYNLSPSKKKDLYSEKCQTPIVPLEVKVQTFPSFPYWPIMVDYGHVAVTPFILQDISILFFQEHCHLSLMCISSHFCSSDLKRPQHCKSPYKPHLKGASVLVLALWIYNVFFYL